MTARPVALIEALAAKSAELLQLEPTAVLSRNSNLVPAAARSACYQVLREVGWSLEDIGDAFDRDHATVHNQEAKSRLRVRVDPEHAFLVAELRRVLRETTRATGFVTIQARTRAQVWALDQELAVSTALRDELENRIARVQRLRDELLNALADIPDNDVITRGRVSA